MIGPESFPSPESSRVAAVPARMVPLADGRLWGLALPGTRYRPEPAPHVDALGRVTESIRLATRIGYPAAIERLIAALRAACQAPREPAADLRRFAALMALAFGLLRRAHDLGPREAATLLDLDGAGLADLVETVLAIVAGVSPSGGPGPNLSACGGGDARRS